jgi:hypothetical protein
MFKTIIAVCATSVLLVAGCSDSSNDEGSLTADQEAVVELLLTASAEEGIILDEACTREVISRLPDDDARALAEADDPNDVSVSTVGEEIGNEVVNCVDSDTLANALADDLESQGVTVDRECLREVLTDVDPAEFFGDSTTEPDSELTARLEACID